MLLNAERVRTRKSASPEAIRTLVNSLCAQNKSILICLSVVPIRAMAGFFVSTLNVGAALLYSEWFGRVEQFRFGISLPVETRAST
jgi:hypothetical protein